MSPSPDDDVDENQVVQELLPLDEAYLDLEVEYQKKVVELQQEYEKKQHELLEERASILRRGSEDYGTPRLPAFWLTALKNNTCLNERIYDWDEPVLKYLEDITYVQLPDVTGLDNAGFRLVFTFSENPYFSNEKLVKEYHTKLVSHWTGDVEVTHIDSDEIEWKEGQDVTVEVIKKKSKSRKKGVSGGGVKHVKESRPSFFRAFFRNLRKGQEPPSDLVQIIREDEEEDMSDEEDDDLMEMIIDDDYDKGCALRQQIIPYAVRWYTGEASPEEEDEEEDEEDEEDDEDDSEEYPETESSPEGKKRKGKKNLFASDPAEGGPKGEEEAECKQQ